jgi:hypothetical protein
MKKGFLLAILSTQFLTSAQENWGKITFKTISIPTADGAGTYAVPIRDCSAGAGVSGAHVGLFLPDPSSFDSVSFAPFATALTGTSAQTAPYVSTPASQTITVPGYPPGSRAVIVIRFWTGSEYGSSFPFGQWVLTTLPLGGIPPGGGDEISTPSLTGWGPEDGSGLNVDIWPPHVSVYGPKDGAVYAAPATIQVNVSFGADPGYAATNLKLYADKILIADETPSGPGTPHSYQTPPLGPGKYPLYSIIHGGYGSCMTEAQSIPINITVVDPIDIALTSPAIANGQLTFQYTANPGLSYSIETSTNLKDWQTIDTTKPTTSPALFTQPLNSATPTFYRIQRLPNP